jgi:hypothetical protein
VIIDPKQQNERKKVESLIAREKPSQIPMNVIKTNYKRMLRHCMTQDVAFKDLFACRKNGARVLVRVVLMNVFDRETETLLNTDIPVGVMYCSGCDKVPNTRKGDKVYKDQLQTVSM